MNITPETLRRLAAEVRSVAPTVLRHHDRGVLQDAAFALEAEAIHRSEQSVLFVGGPRDGWRQTISGPSCGLVDVPLPDGAFGRYRLQRVTYKGAPEQSFLGFWEGVK